MTRKTTNSATNYPIDAVYTTKVRFFCEYATYLLQNRYMKLLLSDKTQIGQ